MPLFYAPPFLRSYSIAGIKNNTRLSKQNATVNTLPIEKLLNQNPNVKELNLFEF